MFLPLLQLVCVLDVFSHRARIRVALSTAGILADVRLSRDVRLHVFRTVARVVELLCAALVVTLVGLFPRMRANVQLEILQAREGASARGIFTPVRFLSRVAAEMSDELIAGIEWLPASCTVLPLADILVHGQGMISVQVPHE